MKIIEDLVIDYGIIFNVSSKWKNYVRKEISNNKNELFQNIDKGLKLITQKDCDGY